MGVEGSKEGGAAESSKRLSRGIPRAARQNLIARWRKRQLPVQLFAVARHVERADGAFALVDGGVRWTQTADFRQWPLDPPISDGGMEEARLLGHKVRGLAEKTDSSIHVVICSPYCRCIQTAVEICRELGPSVRMLIDRELGEVYGPTIMGHEQPHFPVRPIEHTHAYCRSRSVVCHPKLIGRWPAWPEDLKSARHRYANRFLTYLQRSTTTRRNFILVTHADCVGAALSMMPSQADQAVQSVEYGGCFLAKRVRRDSKPTLAENGRRKSLPNFAHVCPVSDDNSAADTGLTDCEQRRSSTYDHLDIQSDVAAAPMMEAWLSEDMGAAGFGQKNSDAALDDQIALELPLASDGWQVHASQIQMCSKGKSATSNGKIATRFSKRVKTLAKNSSFSKEQITKLLGDLSDQPLGDEPLSIKALDGGEDEFLRSVSMLSPQTLSSFPTNVSLSTYLFGSSEAGELSDACSDNSIHSPRRSTESITNGESEILDVLSMTEILAKKCLICAHASSDPAIVGNIGDGDPSKVGSDGSTLALGSGPKPLRENLNSVNAAVLKCSPESFALTHKALPSRLKKRVDTAGSASASVQKHSSSPPKAKGERLTDCSDGSVEGRILFSSSGNEPLKLKKHVDTAGSASASVQKHSLSPPKAKGERLTDCSDGSLEGRISFSSSGNETNLSEASELRITFGSDCSSVTPRRILEVTKGSGQLCMSPRSTRRTLSSSKARRMKKKKLVQALDLPKDAGAGGCGGSSLKRCHKGNYGKLIEGPQAFGDESRAAGAVTIINAAKPVGEERKVVPLQGFDGSTLLQRRNKHLILHAGASVVGLPSLSSQPRVNAEQSAEMEGRFSTLSAGNADSSSSGRQSEQSQRPRQVKSIKDASCFVIPPRSAKRTVASWKTEESVVQGHDSTRAVASGACVDVPKTGGSSNDADIMSEIDYEFEAVNTSTTSGSRQFGNLRCAMNEF